MESPSDPSRDATESAPESAPGDERGQHHTEGHSHAHVDLELNRRVRTILDTVALALAVVTILAMVFVNSTRADVPENTLLPSETYRATVVSVELGPCGEDFGDGLDCRIVTYELTQGPDKGQTRQQVSSNVEEPSLRLHTGDKIMVDRYPDSEAPNDYRTSGDQQRQPLLLLLLVLFVVAVVVLGRLRGFAALGGLALSLLVIVQFTLPSLLGGRDPVLVAVLTASAVAYLALYLAHGFNPLTTVALLGTLASLVLIIIASALFTEAAHFTGLADEESLILANLLGDAGVRIDFVGLILAGTVIGALGALDDMTVTQASAVAELHRANPGLGVWDLYRRALRIGRDHISSTVNTLALAYVGAALPTLMIFLYGAQSLGTVANRELVAVEIVRTLVGSLGLVAAVPITTMLAAFVVRAGIHETGRHAIEPKAPRPSRRGRTTSPVPSAAEGDDQFWRK